VHFVRDALSELSDRSMTARTETAGGGAIRRESDDATRVRRAIEVFGRVQGVGFRPSVVRLAARFGLGGWVANHRGGARIEIEGNPLDMEGFEAALMEIGAPARIDELRSRAIAPVGESGFRAIESRIDGRAEACVPPDVAVCESCLSEMNDARDRRFGYPLVTCARCGPRCTIVETLPYDRERTTMAPFEPCAECAEEYGDPDDRRFHAETIACAECGPRVEWVSSDRAPSGDPIENAALALARGGVVALKGIGGYHLLADATNEAAVERARRIKRRPAKPLAVMFADLRGVEREARVSPIERERLQSAEAPIVLLDRKPPGALAPNVAPECARVGAFLPYSPLHHLLLRRLGRPVVATSLNVNDEPIEIDDAAIEGWLDKIDGALVHDRRILRRADDSVERAIDGAATALRLGRGHAPLVIPIPPTWDCAREADVLALGGHEKVSLALARGGVVHLGPHLGDLETVASREAYRDAVEDFIRLYDVRPALVVADAHPDFFSTRMATEIAERFDCAAHFVQHHYAHLCAASLENPPKRERALGVCWDGTGLGDDGTIWGGEWIEFDPRAPRGYRRAASLAPFELPGGERCAREPWRVALALGRAAGIDADSIALAADRSGFKPESQTRKGVEKAIGRGGATRTTSAGRLFDGFASLLGLRHRARYSAQPAIELEQLAEGESPHRLYELPIESARGMIRLDWRPMARETIEDLGRGVDRAAIAAAFHDSLAVGAAEIALSLGAREAHLTGGCFQNRRLAESMARELRARGVEPHLHRRIPPGDGGLAAGQALAGLFHLSTIAKGA
jgi:hydrogenase maturation protein HypF